MDRVLRQFESVERNVRTLEQTVTAVGTMIEETVEQVGRLKEDIGLTGQPDLFEKPAVVNTDALSGCLCLLETHIRNRAKEAALAQVACLRSMLRIPADAESAAPAVVDAAEQA